jgi:hypothetical protein
MFRLLLSHLQAIIIIYDVYAQQDGNHQTKTIIFRCICWSFTYHYNYMSRDSQRSTFSSFFNVIKLFFKTKGESIKTLHTTVSLKIWGFYISVFGFQVGCGPAVPLGYVLHYSK